MTWFVAGLTTAIVIVFALSLRPTSLYSVRVSSFTPERLKAVMQITNNSGFQVRYECVVPVSYVRKSFASTLAPHGTESIPFLIVGQPEPCEIQLTGGRVIGNSIRDRWALALRRFGIDSFATAELRFTVTNTTDWMQPINHRSMLTSVCRGSD